MKSEELSEMVMVTNGISNKSNLSKTSSGSKMCQSYTPAKEIKHNCWEALKSYFQSKIKYKCQLSFFIPIFIYYFSQKKKKKNQGRSKQLNTRNKLLLKEKEDNFLSGLLYFSFPLPADCKNSRNIQCI